MSKQVATIPTREDFVGWIGERLTGAGFTKSEDKEFWKYERDIQTPGQVVIINGKRQDQPGETHHIEFQVEVFGDGEVKDTKTGQSNPFIEVNFNVFQDHMDISEWPTFCIFFDDQMLFNSLINKIFGI